MPCLPMGIRVRNADRAEVAALQAALGEHARAVPITVPKAGTGRACSGAAPLDVAAAVLALRDGNGRLRRPAQPISRMTLTW